MWRILLLHNVANLTPTIGGVQTKAPGRNPQSTVQSVIHWRTYGPDQKLCLPWTVSDIPTGLMRGSAWNCLWCTYSPDERLCLPWTVSDIPMVLTRGSALNCVWHTYGPDERLCFELSDIPMVLMKGSALNCVWHTYGPDERLCLEMCLTYLWPWRKALLWTVSDIPMVLTWGSVCHELSQPEVNVVSAEHRAAADAAIQCLSTMAVNEWRLSASAEQCEQLATHLSHHTWWHWANLGLRLKQF